MLWKAVGLSVASAMLISGCASREIIPEALEQQVDRTVAFKDLSGSPDTYRGHVVLLGGEILNARYVKDGTQFEILQLPLEESQEPSTQRSETQGRFLAVDGTSPDPAKFARGTRVTMVGEVTGARVQSLDESDYRYPTLDIKHLHVWDDRSAARPGYRPWWGGIFGGVGIGSGGGGGSFGGVSIGTGF